MRKHLFLGWACALGMSLFAQNDPVLIWINGKEVPRSEFEYFYRHHHVEADSKLTSNELVKLFIDRKLKVDAARSASMDTSSSFKQAQKAFREEFLKSYLIDSRVTDSCALILYNKLKNQIPNGQVRMTQILKRLPQTITSTRLRVEQARMDSLYAVIKNHPDMDFSLLVDRYSDDKQFRWIEPLEATPELEEIAFSLAKGEVSQPFLTPVGIHILKVVDRREMPSFEIFCELLAERMNRGTVLDIEMEAMVARLKKEYQYTANNSGVEELLSKGETKLTLFTIDGKAYTGELFKRFAASHPQAVKRQLNSFISKSILDYEKSNIEKKHPDLRDALREYEENALIAQITHQKVEVLAANDRAGLATYFKFHQSDYHWKTPRYRGVVLHCVDKKTARLAKKIMKKVPEKLWVDTIRSAFNASGVEKIKMEQGLFAEGDNKYIDKLVFKTGSFQPIPSYPFTIIAGKKRKGPDEYREVINQLQKDYRNYLEVCWTQDLRAYGKVEVNQDVLKTVNNE